MSEIPVSADRLSDRFSDPNAFLSRADLSTLGLGRRQVDAVFRALPIVVFPETRRPLVRVADYLALLECCTYDGTKVR